MKIKQKINDLIENDDLICLIRYFPDYKSPNSLVFPIYKSNLRKDEGLQKSIIDLNDIPKDVIDDFEKEGKKALIRNKYTKEFLQYIDLENRKREFEKNAIAFYDNKGCLIFKHPDTKKEHSLIEKAHQLKGIDFYFVMEQFKDSIPIELCPENDKLVNQWFSPSDMANKTSSKILEKKIRKAQGRDKQLIYFIISSIMLIFVICSAPFLPVLFNILAG